MGDGGWEMGDGESIILLPITYYPLVLSDSRSITPYPLIKYRFNGFDNIFLRVGFSDINIDTLFFAPQFI
jgi:hypothetical protein